MLNTNKVALDNQQAFGNTESKQVKSGEIGNKRLVLMWFLILLGYFLFVVQWYSIGNFAGGYNKNIGAIANPALNAMPNWTITLMRGVGSILAGWLMVKIGHKWAVTTVLSLMVASFPFIIFASVKGIGEPVSDGVGGYYYAANFGMFLFFRLFLAVGGTTLITYTNPVIAKMSAADRPKFLTINQFGFNGGAFFANIFFCFGISKVINSGDAWIYILSAFVVLVAALLVAFVLLSKEVVPAQKKQSNVNTITDANEITFGRVIKQSYTWKMICIFIPWLVAVVFINSSTMRNVIEQSPANFQALAQWNYETGKWVTSMSASTLSTSTSVAVGSGYEWVWPTFICLFVGGFFVGLFVISPFNKTIYKRKPFIHSMFAIGYVFAFASLMCGYFGGYANKAALAFYFIFIFLAGMFLWAVQPVLLSLYQQCPQASPKYAGIIAGLIWGVGYVGYTLVELILSVALSYAQKSTFATDMGKLMEQINTSTGGNAMDIINNFTHKEIAGTYIVWVGFAIVLALVFIPIQLLPAAGVKDANGNFVPFSKTWKPWDWNFRRSDILIK